MKTLVEKLSIEDLPGFYAGEVWAEYQEYQTSMCPQCGSETYRMGGYCSRNCEKDARDAVEPS